MKHILTLILLPLAALALDPDQPVVRLQNDVIVQQLSGLPGIYGSTVNYHAAGEDQWNADGWRQAVITTVTTTNTVQIPEAIQAVAAAYKQAFEGIYGEGATTNRALTRDAVAIDLSLRPDVSADTGIRLSTWFEILNGYWGRGEIWTFPFGESTYTTTNVVEEWTAE